MDALDRLARHIAQRVKGSTGSRPSVVQPEGLSNRTPSLRVCGTDSSLASSGEAVARTLLDAEPRIALFRRAATIPRSTGVSITPYMMCRATRRSSPTGSTSPLEPAEADSHASARGACGGHWRALGRAHRVRRQRVAPHAAPEAARQRLDRARTRATSCRAISPARSTAAREAAQQLRRAARRRAELHVHGHSDRRRDGGHARHGRIPEREMDREDGTSPSGADR